VDVAMVPAVEVLGLAQLHPGASDRALAPGLIWRPGRLAARAIPSRRSRMRPSRKATPGSLCILLYPFSPDPAEVGESR